MEYTKSVETLCHSEPFLPCHSEGALRPCHSERSEESYKAQGKLREESGDPSLSLRVTSESSPRITVLGIGNLLLKDEGVGVHLVQKLAGVVGDANVKIIDAGTYPDFLSLIDGSTDKLIIVDAAKGGDRPGTIYRFSFDGADLDTVLPISLHEMGVLDSLKTMTLFNRQPKSTVIIGIEPKTMDFGLDLSPEIEDKLPGIIELVLKEIEETTAMEVDK
ncbi:MAG: HyaD/HybD family hydrogenase maturation endopeptidase [Dehalococcoidia bacterium]